MENPVLAWFVKAIPWKDCPFNLQAIVVTPGGPERAKEKFLETFKNPALEISECAVVEVIKDELIIEDKDVGCARA